jgi:hypothetical protein
MTVACVDCGVDIAARVARYHLARRCVGCTAALNSARAATRYAAHPRRELDKSEASAVAAAVVELDRLRAEARALRRAYSPAPPLHLVRANETQQRATRARIAELLAANAVAPVGRRARFAGGGMRPAWDARW